MADPPEENVLYRDDISGGGSSAEYQQGVSHLPLDQARLTPSAGQEEVIGDPDRGRTEVCQPPSMSAEGVGDDGDRGDTAREKEMTAR